MSWINKSFTPKIAEGILWKKNCFEIWNELMDQFYQGGVFKKIEIQEEICNMKQGDYI